MSTFVRASTWDRASAKGGDVATFATFIDPSWVQGRGAFGGLIAAGMLRAMMALVADERRQPRTLHVHYCAPAKPGPLEVEVRTERAGASMITLSARARQDGQVVSLATATLAFSRPRHLAPAVPRAVYCDAAMPSVPDAASLPPVPADMPLMPTFTQHFEYRFCVGEPPYAGAARSLLGGWVRPRDATVLDAPLAAALIDAYPPAVYARLDAPRASASVNLTIDFHTALPLEGAAADAHHLLVSSSRVGDGSVTDESLELWTPEPVVSGASEPPRNRLVATCRQHVVLL